MGRKPALGGYIVERMRSPMGSVAEQTGQTWGTPERDGWPIEGAAPETACL
jgi:hypothetical protein